MPHATHGHRENHLHSAERGFDAGVSQHEEPCPHETGSQIVWGPPRDHIGLELGADLAGCVTRLCVKCLVGQEKPGAAAHALPMAYSRASATVSWIGNF
jgi:hypothetical protein